MATDYKILGQAALAATTNTDVYTVPAATSAVVSTIVVANRNSSANNFRLALRPSGAAISNEHYIAYDVPIAANDSITLTLGLTLGASDVITAYGGAGSSLSVNIAGSEIT